jgi:hypothetical protein
MPRCLRFVIINVEYILMLRHECNENVIQVASPIVGVSLINGNNSFIRNGARALAFSPPQTCIGMIFEIMETRFLS